MFPTPKVLIKKDRRPAESLDDRIKNCIEAKLTWHQMTKVLGCSTKTIQERMVAMGLLEPPKPKQEPRRMPPTDDGSENLMKEAAFDLGAEIRNGSYWLGGKPIGAKELLRRYNIRRKSYGLEPIGRWL